MDAEPPTGGSRRRTRAAAVAAAPPPPPREELLESLVSGLPASVSPTPFDPASAADYNDVPTSQFRRASAPIRPLGARRRAAAPRTP